MTRSSPVLAVAIDAAEASLVLSLAADGRLPHIAQLIDAGRVGKVRSPASIGSGAVWPTFMTGHPPDLHGLFGEYAWNGTTMSLERPVFGGLLPLIGLSIIAQTGNIYAGLYYPIAVAAATFVIGSLFLTETHQKLIWKEVDPDAVSRES